MDHRHHLAMPAGRGGSQRLRAACGLNEMQRRRFGRTGLEVPALTFGGGWVGGLLIRGSEQEREAVLDHALAAGIDWIDTAALYGNGVSETVIGRWLAKLPVGRRP